MVPQIGTFLTVVAWSLHLAACQISIMTPMNSSKTSLMYPSTTASIPLRYHCDDITSVVCLEVLQLSVGPVLQSTCIPCSQNDHSLSNMGAGKYEIVLRLQDNPEYITNHIFSILSVEDGLPDIVVPEAIELLASPPLFKGDLSLQYELVNAAANVVKQIDVCLKMENIATGEVALAQACVQSSHNVIGLNTVAEGDYELTLVCRSALHPYTMFPSSEKVVNVGIHRNSAFLPTYDWKRVRAWESVPSGLEIRLPIGETGGQKVAKIPEPWRLQVPLPTPCKYFLRMDIFKHTTAQDILDAAAKTCKLAPECFGLFVSDKEVTHEDMRITTSEDMELFQNDIAIEVLPICQNEP